MKIIFTEQPDFEQWIRINKFTYEKNIKDYFASKNILEYDSLLIEKISGSLNQAYEYFQTAKNTSLHISPLLVYYGYTNLLYGIMCLKTGKNVIIKDHGMKIQINDDMVQVGEVSIRPVNNDTGGLAVYSKYYSNNIKLCDSGEWGLNEVLGMIPELHHYFMELYNKNPFVLPIERVNSDSGYLERIIISDERIKKLLDYFYEFNHVKKTYLRPQVNDNYVILRKKIHSEDITVSSLSGERFLQLPIIKNGAEYIPNKIVSYLMALFTLSYLSRYRPETWFPFVNNDNSGEKLIFEKFISLSIRVLPNIVLNELENEEYIFTNKMNSVIETEKKLTRREIENMINEIIGKKKKVW